MYTGGEFNGVDQSVLCSFSYINNINCFGLPSIQTSNRISDMLFIYDVHYNGWFTEFDTAKG